MALRTEVFETFKNSFEGELRFEHGQLKIGRDAGMAQPYDLLLGALGACYYATFLGIVEKKRLHFAGAELKIVGQKREEVPTTLKTVQMDVCLKGVDPADQHQFEKSAELAAKYCSIHETIQKVGDIEIKLSFA